MTVPELSPVEEQIVHMVADGQSRESIARELGVSVRTVAVVDTWRIGLGPKGKTSAQALQARTSANKVASDSDLLIRQALRPCSSPKRKRFISMVPSKYADAMTRCPATRRKRPATTRCGRAGWRATRRCRRCARRARARDAGR